MRATLRAQGAKAAAARQRRVSCQNVLIKEEKFDLNVKKTRYAVVGAGFAGMAACWHLLQVHRSRGEAVQLDVYDAVGIAGGASGAAAGLLHPYNTRGKLIWKGMDGVRATVELLSVAESATKDEPSPFYRCGGIVRPATTSKQASDFVKHVGKEEVPDGWDAELVDYATAKALLPGLQSATDSWPEEDEAFAMYIQKGIVIHPERYLKRLWKACQMSAEDGGGEARFHRQRIDSVQGMDLYTAVILAGGAATPAIREVKDVNLPLTMCLGQVIELIPKDGQTVYPTASPSILGGTYLAAQDERRIVVGATKLYNVPESAEQARSMLGKPVDPDVQEHVESKLCTRMDQVYPLISNWTVHAVKQGVRAMPPRSSLGSLPLMGRLSPATSTRPATWYLVGLGARGLVYHALLAHWLAQAVAHNDPERVPPELAPPPAGRTW